MSETHWQGCDTVHPDCHHPALLALTDLIAELRDEHRMDNGGYCETCDVERWPCPSERAADWAEARLRTLQTPGGSAGADLKEGEGSGDA